jgi:DinB superfamily
MAQAKEAKPAGAGNETVDQYKQRILGNLGGKKPLEIQAETVERLEKLINGADSKKLGHRPTPEKWSVNEVMAHLADSELVSGYRLRTILGAPGGPIEAYDQDKWAEAGNYGKQSAREALETFAALRRANLRLMRSLKPEQWKLFGVHSERGEESVERLAEMIAGHDINHTKQIEALLA